MEEISEFIYQVFGAVLFCVGIMLLIVRMNNRNEYISYKDTYGTVVAVETETDNCGTCPDLRWSRDDIIAAAAARCVEKIMIGTDVYMTDTGTLSELLGILRCEWYTTDYHAGADGGTVEVICEPAE